MTVLDITSMSATVMSVTDCILLREEIIVRVFVTGATGFIGSAVVSELIGAGYQVLGLARSDGSVAALEGAGAEAHRGSLDDLESLRSGAEVTDGVIHTAFVNDFSDYAGAAERDRRAIEALGGALAGSDRPFVATSVTTLLTPGRLGTEEDVPDPGSASVVRIGSEEAALSAALRGVRSSVVRLPPSVHGEGDLGFVPALIAVARDRGVSAYVGDGANRWPAVHRHDAARLYRLGLKESAPGMRLHAVAEEGVPMREIAKAIGERLGAPVHGIAPKEAEAHFDWLSLFVGVDNPTSSTLSRERLGWKPQESELLTDLRESGYFS